MWWLDAITITLLLAVVSKVTGRTCWNWGCVNDLDIVLGVGVLTFDKILLRWDLLLLIDESVYSNTYFWKKKVQRYVFQVHLIHFQFLKKMVTFVDLHFLCAWSWCLTDELRSYSDNSKVTKLQYSPRINRLTLIAKISLISSRTLFRTIPSDRVTSYSRRTFTLPRTSWTK